MSGWDHGDKEAAEKFLKEQFDKIDPSIREKKMTFREAAKIIDEFTFESNYEPIDFLDDLSGTEKAIKILEVANYDTEKAAKIYRTYNWINTGTQDYEDDKYLHYTPTP